MKEERIPHTKKPLHRQRLWVAEGGALEPRRRVQPQGCRGQSGEIPPQRKGADQHSPVRESYLLTRWGGWGLGAEARALVGSQGEDWGWQREHSLHNAQEIFPRRRYNSCKYLCTQHRRTSKHKANANSHKRENQQ